MGYSAEAGQEEEQCEVQACQQHTKEQKRVEVVLDDWKLGTLGC